VRAQFTPAAVAELPDPVPVTYTGTTHIVADVDRQTGVAIDEAISEQIVVNVMVGARPVSLLPVLALDFHITPASIHYLADKASSAGRLLTILTIVVPIGLGVIGVILIVVAVIRRKKPQPSSPGPQGPPARRREGLVSASAPTASTT
jgi:heme/copper-type cytochrome/quinol oxidase subunit 2